MSFADLESGVRLPARSGPSLSQDRDRNFKALADRISIQIFKIDSNVVGITKVLELLTRGGKDTPETRARLHDLTEATREHIKKTTADVRALAQFQVPPENRHQLAEQQKVSRDFQQAVGRFTAIQRESVERQRRSVDRAKAAADDTALRSPHDTTEDESQRQHLQQVQQESVPDYEVEFQETLIQEREGEIQEIEAGIHELNEIFRDLGTIVTEQQSMIDNIESNVYSIADDTQGADEQLTQAHDYQRRAGKRMLCLLLIFIVVLAVVLIAVLA